MVGGSPLPWFCAAARSADKTSKRLCSPQVGRTSRWELLTPSPCSPMGQIRALPTTTSTANREADMRINRHLRRPAVTLIELMVVVSITLLIAGLAYMAMPNLQSRRMVDAADRLTGWLLVAKMQAKRDNRPTGIRLV